MSEVRHIRSSPLRLHLPHHLTELVRELDYSELRHRQTSLQVHMKYVEVCMYMVDIIITWPV